MKFRTIIDYQFDLEVLIWILTDQSFKVSPLLIYGWEWINFICRLTREKETVTDNEIRVFDIIELVKEFGVSKESGLSRQT